jgi:DNA-binding NarL/FixJ family response regulator
LDLVIPGKKVTDTLKELRQYDPNVKALVCSGYSNDPIMENFQEYGFEAAITKPYKITELNKVLNRVLLDSSQ